MSDKSISMIPRFNLSDELTPVVRLLIGSVIGLLVILMAACSSVLDAPALPVIERPTPSVSLSAPAPTPYPWSDASAVMSGLCFESVDDAVDHSYLIRTPEALANFFDLADHSDLCRHPVRRADFDFSGGNILAGVWSRAVGCTAHHDVMSVQRDDVAKTYTILLLLVVDGGCDYELVRPFWISLSGLADYDVRLVVVR